MRAPVRLALEIRFGCIGVMLATTLISLLACSVADAKTNSSVATRLPASASTSEGLKAFPVMLLYDPTRASELPVFTGNSKRFIQSARTLRPKFNAISSREKVQFLENYIFSLCNARIVNGMSAIYTLETGTEGFCGYQPGILNCFAADNCDKGAQEEAVSYIRRALAKYDNFIRWSERRKWQYRGDALHVAFYTRNTPGKYGDTCASLKLINDNPQPIIVKMRGSVRSDDGKMHGVFGKPYYVAAKSSLPNLSDEDLFNKDTEARMRTLTADALALSKRLSIPDIQAYTGTHEKWNCFSSRNGGAAQAVLQQIVVEFPQ